MWDLPAPHELARQRPSPHDQRVDRPRRRIVALVAVLATLALGASACGDGDDQGRIAPELEEVEAQVAQLRLEVQTLRRELQALRGATTEDTSPTVITTTTTTTVR
jgi:outer membrane murein-binding lipoprotein Lpp